MQTTPSAVEIDTPYPNGRGSFPTSRQFRLGDSSRYTRSYQTFLPPSHGIVVGKFAPPATTSTSFCVPANGPAKPSWSGNAGNSRHFKVSWPYIQNTLQWDKMRNNRLRLPITQTRDSEFILLQPSCFATHLRILSSIESVSLAFYQLI